MKYSKFILFYDICPVAPLVGAWVEISGDQNCICSRSVAPLVGAWVEIEITYENNIPSESLPSWERGLKSPDLKKHGRKQSRSPRGSVG